MRLEPAGVLLAVDLSYGTGQDGGPSPRQEPVFASWFAAAPGLAPGSAHERAMSVNKEEIISETGTMRQPMQPKH
jgi:hypothetical protein